MSQRAFLQQFDAAAFSAFQQAGIGDRAHYYPPSGTTAVDCDVLLDRNMRDYGDDQMPIGTDWTRVSFQLAQLLPERGGLVAILDDDGNETEAFTLDARIQLSDESLSHWVVLADG